EARNCSARERSVHGGESQYRRMWALLCSAKRSFASASSKARSRRRAVCNEGVGSDVLMFPPLIGGRTIRHPMRVTRNGFSRRSGRTTCPLIGATEHPRRAAPEVMPGLAFRLG